MSIKTIILISFATALIGFGVIWFQKSLSGDEPYDFREDFRHSFLTPHWTYSAFLNDGKPRRIAPTILIIGGLGLLVVSLRNLF